MNPLSLIFRQGNQTLFYPSVLLKIENLEFIIPCEITIRLRKKIVITEIYGADFTVKEDFGLSDYQITITGKIGTTESSPGAKICGLDKTISACDFIKKLTDLFKQKKPLSISDVNPEYATNIIGNVAKKIDQAFDLPLGPLKPEGILATLGITKIVLLSLDINPLPAGYYQFTISAMSEPETDIMELENPNLFLEEK
jgi:hypothetical protein